MRNKDHNIIHSVIGFDFTPTTKDQNDELIIPRVIHSEYKSDDEPDSMNKVFNKSFWTSFDQELYNKILDCKKYKNC